MPYHILLDHILLPFLSHCTPSLSLSLSHSPSLSPTALSSPQHGISSDNRVIEMGSDAIRCLSCVGSNRTRLGDAGACEGAGEGEDKG